MRRLYSRSDLLAIAACLVFVVAALPARQQPDMLWVIGFFGSGGLFLLLLPLLMKRRARAGGERVQFDQVAIHRTRPSGQIETIAWSDLAEIEIVTTDEGPYANDVTWLFSNAERTSGCAVANDAAGFAALLEQIQRLPGFDNEAVIRAMTSVSNQSFLVWQRSAAHPGPTSDTPAP